MPDDCDLGKTETVQEIETGRFTEDEIRTTARKLNSGKGPGIDNINAETLQAAWRHQ